MNAKRTTPLSKSKRAKIRRAYGALVNLTTNEVRRLLAGPTSALGGTPELPLEPETIDELLAIQRKRQAELTEADHRLMDRAVKVIRALLSRRPSGDVQRSSWRRRLMLLGHDPLRRSCS